MNPNNAYTYDGRGKAKYEKGDYDGAIADFDKAISLDSNDVDAYNGRGKAKDRKGDHEGAKADHEKALEREVIFHHT